MELEELLAKITELTNTVKENKGTDGLNKEALVADFKALMEEYNQKLLDSMPKRQGEIIETRAIDQYQGRYKSVLKDISRTGSHKMGSTETKAVDLFLAKLIMEKAVASGMSGAKAPSEDLVNAVKAMTATGAATGDELVPTNMAGELWQDFFAASRVAGDIPNQPMTSDPMDVSLGLGDSTWRKGSENTATTATDLATAKSVLTATEQVTEVNWSYNLDEDAIVALMPAVRARLAQSGGEQMDAFVLNADATDASTGNINLDDADPDADAYYLSAGQDGIRHQFLVDYTGQGVNVAAAIDDAHMNETLAKLGKYGLDYNNVRIVPDIQTYFSMLGMTNVATVDKYGPSATILTGELARYRGIPIIPSASMPLTEADGKACKTAASNVKGQIAMYNRNGWRVGYRRGLTIEVDRLIQKRQLVMVVSFRIAVAAFGARASAKHTAGAYGIAL